MLMKKIHSFVPAAVLFLFDAELTVVLLNYFPLTPAALMPV